MAARNEWHAIVGQISNGVLALVVRLIPFIMDHLLRDQPAELTGGEQVRDFLHVADVADALLAAAESTNLRPHQAYNVCSSRPASVREVGEIAADALGKPRALLEWGTRPYRADESMWVVGDNTNFSKATGWQPRLPAGRPASS